MREASCCNKKIGSSVTKAGFVAVLGRRNAGKSTLLNALLSETLALVSHKANAPRKRMHLILMEGETQIIFEKI